MSESLSLGPFVVSTAALLVVGAWAIGWGIGGVLNRARDPAIARLLTRAFAVALVAARGAWVVEWLGAYLAHPIDIVDLRDGGWNLPVGLLLAWLYVLASGPRGKRGAGPVHAALAASLLLFAAGTFALQRYTDLDRRLALHDLQVTALDGTATTLQAFAGRPAVVNLWATWCGPCRREMPMLARAEAAHPEVAFVFVNQGEPAGPVQRYLHDEGLSLRHVFFDTASQVARAIDLRGWPTTIYLDANGRVIAVDVGALSAAKLEQRLAALPVRLSPR